MPPISETRAPPDFVLYYPEKENIGRFVVPRLLGHDSKMIKCIVTTEAVLVKQDIVDHSYRINLSEEDLWSFFKGELLVKKENDTDYNEVVLTEFGGISFNNWNIGQQSTAPTGVRYKKDNYLRLSNYYTLLEQHQERILNLFLNHLQIKNFFWEPTLPTEVPTSLFILYQKEPVGRYYVCLSIPDFGVITLSKAGIGHTEQMDRRRQGAIFTILMVEGDFDLRTFSDLANAVNLTHHTLIRTFSNNGVRY